MSTRTRVGILGGGQLGTMLAAALQKLDAEVSVYDPDPYAPALARVSRGMTAPWTDPTALARFLGGLDVLTYEFENVEGSALAPLAAPRPVIPSLGVLEITQHRIREKRFLSRSSLPHVAFRAVESADRLDAEARDFGLPLILKTARGGYDGHGQRRIDDERELAAAVAELSRAEAEGRYDGGYVLEEPLALALEVSCIVARSPREEVVFPVFENLHRHHILDYTLLPARVSDELAARAQSVALQAARAFDLHGLLTVEFFVGVGERAGDAGVALPDTPEGRPQRLYINEFAPRPHNSGHVTLSACVPSQFDALARILVGAPVHAPRLVGPGAWCMGNLLGDVWYAQQPEAAKPTAALDLSAWERHPAVVDVVLYGKREPRPARKMGHFIVHAGDADAALAAARRFREDLARPR